MELILRRASIKRRSIIWQDEDYNVLHGKRAIGRIYRVDADGGRATWFWGVSFQVTGPKSYGHADSLEAAKAAFRAKYAAMASHPMSDEQRLLLELLDSAEDGCTASLLVALGFETDLAVAAGLAVSATEPELVGESAVDVTRVRTTAAGRQALAE